MALTARRLGPHDPSLPDALALIHAAFAPMEGRIDPPSSVHRLDLAALADAAARDELWALGDPVAATVILRRKDDALELGKLAVAATARRRGHARALIEHAAARARALGLPALRLQTRVELTENHAAFAAMGFREIARRSHPSFDRPTSITFERPLA